MTSPRYKAEMRLIRTDDLVERLETLPPSIDQYGQKVRRPVDWWVPIFWTAYGLAIITMIVLVLWAVK